MKKRTAVRIASFSIAFALSFFVFAFSSYTQAKYYRQQLENNYQQSLNELSEYMSSIENAASKTIYATSDTMLSQLSSDLWRECSGAKATLGRLPVGELNLETTYKFLSQVGEYSLAITKKTANGEPLTEQERRNLVILADYAQKLNDAVNKVLAVYSNGERIVDDNIISTQSLESGINVTSSFEKGNEIFSNYPTLIYDGPFSEHLLNKLPAMTKDQKEVSRETAQQKIASIKGMNIGELSYNGTDEAVIALYNFSDKYKNYSVTKYGGYLCSILSSREVKEVKVHREDALATAKKFLEDNGFKNMEATYYADNNGVLIVNFAYKENGILYYTDLIKVGVALDNNEVVSFDARGYISNHKQRTVPEEKYTMEQCAANISDLLTITSGRKVLIPTKTGGEVFAYEYHCVSKKDSSEILVYVDTQTGKETDILFMLYTDDGIFTK